MSVSRASVRCCSTWRPHRAHPAAHLSIREHFDVGARGIKPELAQIALKDAVHFCGLVPLALRLLDVELCLLGDVEGDVLVRGLSALGDDGRGPGVLVKTTGRAYVDNARKSRGSKAE